MLMGDGLELSSFVCQGNMAQLTSNEPQNSKFVLPQTRRSGIDLSLGQSCVHTPYVEAEFIA